MMVVFVVEFIAFQKSTESDTHYAKFHSKNLYIISLFYCFNIIVTQINSSHLGACLSIVLWMNEWMSTCTVVMCVGLHAIEFYVSQHPEHCPKRHINTKIIQKNRYNCPLCTLLNITLKTNEIRAKSNEE